MPVCYYLFGQDFYLLKTTTLRALAEYLKKDYVVIVSVYTSMEKAMNRDILFKTDDFSIIGGHVSCMETTQEALKREFKEELHTDIEVDNLMAVGEIFFPWGEKLCHQICLYYKVHLLENHDLPLEGSFFGYDELDNQRIDLEFRWVPLGELEKGVKVYPR